MSIRQRFYLYLTICWGVVAVAMLVWMIWCGDYRLWAAELAVLCAGAMSLLGYAREWRRLRDERDEGTRRR